MHNALSLLDASGPIQQGSSISGPNLEHAIDTDTDADYVLGFPN